MTANLRTHRIVPGETLATIARRHDLPGWQALYFWEGNQDFRNRCPDPWHLEAETSLSIPELTLHSEGLFRALDARLRLIDQVRRSARQLLDRQGEMLRNCSRESSISRPTRSRQPEPADVAIHTPAYRLTSKVVETTLEAIQLLKAGDSGMSRANWALAKDALARRVPTDPSGNNELLTLLGRAAEGVIWGIPDPSARAWCDARDPLFWGKRLETTSPAVFDARQTGSMLAIASQQAGDTAIRALDCLHVGALEEAAQIERGIRSIHEPREHSATGFLG